MNQSTKDKPFSHEHQLPEDRCPFCGHTIDRCAGGQNRPREGDISICIGCERMAVFDAHQHLRAPTPAEIEAIPAHILIHVRRAKIALSIVKEGRAVR